MEPIVINRPGIYQKLRNRLGVRTGIGRSAELEMSLQPTIDVDPLLLETRVAIANDVDVDSVTANTVFTVPPGEFWHCKCVSLETVAGTDFSLFFRLLAPNAADPSAGTFGPLSPLHVFSGIDVFAVQLGQTLRPGDDVGWESLVWVAAGGNAVMTLTYDLEDCSS